MGASRSRPAHEDAAWRVNGEPSTIRSIRTGRRTLAITQGERVLFPEAGLTKGALVAYYQRVGRTMLSHIRGRPLVAERFPNGTGRRGLRWHEPPEWFPEWIDRPNLGCGADAAAHLVCSRVPELLFLVEHGMITPHVWSSRLDRLRHPDRMTFDLDPPATTGSDAGDSDAGGFDRAGFDAVREAAELIRRLLERLHLPSFPMTTGSRGMHVVVPLSRRETFDDVHRFAQDVAAIAVAEAPNRIALRAYPDAESTEPSAGSGGRVSIGIHRNGSGRTVVAPYAVRGGPRALVATPFHWDELPRIEPQRLGVTAVLRRFDTMQDPWRNMNQLARSLHRARQPL